MKSKLFAIALCFSSTVWAQDSLTAYRTYLDSEVVAGRITKQKADYLYAQKREAAEEREDATTLQILRPLYTPRYRGTTTDCFTYGINTTCTTR